MTFPVLVLMLVMILVISTPIAYAQQNKTKIIIETDKEEYNIGDTVKVYLKAEQVVDMFGLQFRLNYDPSLLEMQGTDVKFDANYKVFGGKTVDKQNGIIEYPLINPNSTQKTVDVEEIGEVTFTAKNKGPVILTLENIKAVNSDITEIHYNTQYQAVFNIKEESISPGSDTEDDENITEPGDKSGSSRGDKKDDGNTTKPSGKGSNVSKSDNKDESEDKDNIQLEDDSETPSEDDKTADTDVSQPETEDREEETDEVFNPDDETTGGDDSTDESQAPEEAQKSDADKENSKIILISILAIIVIGLLILIYKNKHGLKNALNKLRKNK